VKKSLDTPMTENNRPESFEVSDKQKSFLKKIIPISAFIGGLCCFVPVVLVLLGVSSVSYAISLTDILYGQFVWVFRGLAFLCLAAALIWYFYKKENICSLEEAKRNKQLIINFTFTTLIVTAVAYIIWTYVIVEILGIALGLW
jgi:hypothetical protein